MTRKETIERNIGLTFDFIRKAVDNPSLLDKIPSGSVIEFVEKDFGRREMHQKKKAKKYIRVRNEFEVI